MDVIEKLKEQGWFLTLDGLKKLPENNSDLKKIIQNALDTDFRDIAAGALPTEISKKDETISGKIVLQVAKIRNISAPKANEEHKGAPRFLQLDLTDGITTIQALEMEPISSISLNTPPGTKIYLKSDKLKLMQGIIMLTATDLNVLGGNVQALVEKWEMSRTLLKYAKSGRVNSGSSGPPPWTPYGQKIQQTVAAGNDKNFKSLAAAGEKDKEGKENNEFNTMRNEAIAEASKAGGKKVFGGGNQQIVDHNVKKIMEKGFTEDEAKNALRSTRNNLEKALFNLKRKEEYRKGKSEDYRGKSQPPQSSGISSGKSESVGRGGGRAGGGSIGGRKGGKDDSAVPTKPAANVSLFDFLTDKLPANVTETITASTTSNSVKASSLPPSQSTSRYERQDSRPDRSQRYNNGPKSSHYNNDSSHHSNYSENRQNYNKSSNQQSANNIPSSRSSANYSNQKFENNMSSSFQANRNQDERPNRSRPPVDHRPTNSNKNQSGYQGRQPNYYRHQDQDDYDRYGKSDNRNDSRQDTRGENRTDTKKDSRNDYRNDTRNDYQRQNFNQSSRSSAPRNDEKRERGGGNFHSSSNTSQYQQSQNTGSYENNRRNDNQRNGYDSRGQNSQQSGPPKYTQSNLSTSAVRYQNNKDTTYQSNNSRNYNNDNRNSSYQQQMQNDKVNKIIEDTSKLKLDSKSSNSSRSNNSIQPSQPPRNQIQLAPQQQPPQIIAMIPHHSTNPTMVQHTHHLAPNHQQQQQQQQQTQQAPQQQTTATIQHLAPSPQTAYTQLPNGFAYDPSKIIGFQSKETNEYAMTLLKSQGVPANIAGISGPTSVQQSSVPLQAGPTVTPTVTHAQYIAPPIQLSHPPPQAFPSGAFVMPAASVVPQQIMATPVVTTPQPYTINSGESWNWKIGDRCFAKYWDDGRFYEAEITGISDTTCVVFYLGYGNHEEVLKSDCVPVTDSQNRAINFGGSAAAVAAAAAAAAGIVAQPHIQQIPSALMQQQQQQQRGRYRTEKRQMYIPPPKREV